MHEPARRELCVPRKNSGRTPAILPPREDASVKSRLKLQSYSELDTPRCIALGRHLSKGRVAPVRVRITPQMAIEYVPYIGLERTSTRSVIWIILPIPKSSLK